MAKTRRKVALTAAKNTVSPELPAIPLSATSPGGRARGFVSATLPIVILIVFAWGLLCVRSAWYREAGLQAVREGRSMEAAREFESAIGCYAPLNPFSRAAAEAMLNLARHENLTDPMFSAEVSDRLRRALRSTRGLVQPYPDLLRVVEGPNARALSRDPRIALFLASWLGLLAGLGAWWLPLRTVPKAALGTTGLAIWALTLYFC